VSKSQRCYAPSTPKEYTERLENIPPLKSHVHESIVLNQLASPTVSPRSDVCLTNHKSLGFIAPWLYPTSSRLSVQWTLNHEQRVQYRALMLKKHKGKVVPYPSPPYAGEGCRSKEESRVVGRMYRTSCRKGVGPFKLHQFNVTITMAPSLENLEGSSMVPLALSNMCRRGL
jgi:hypothetical protein